MKVTFLASSKSIINIFSEQSEENYLNFAFCILHFALQPYLLRKEI